MRSFALLLACLLAGTARAAAPKVSVALYEESLCPACVGYFSANPKGVWATYEALGPDVVDLSVTLWGNALGPAASPTCQHGPVECMGNAIWSCAHNMYPAATALPFLACYDAMLIKTFPAGLPPNTVNTTFALSSYETCAAANKLSWSAIQTCYKGADGVKFLAADKAATPPHMGVPFTVIDGVSSANSTTGPPQDLLSVVCAAYTGPKPSACPATEALATDTSYASLSC